MSVTGEFGCQVVSDKSGAAKNAYRMLAHVFPLVGCRKISMRQKKRR
jgi:hypothetical protein